MVRIKRSMERESVRYALLVAVVLGAGACTRTIQSSETSIPGAAMPSVRPEAPDAIGAATPKAAVESFLRAAKAQDLQGMSAIWGTAKGAARDQMKRDDLEKRLIIMQCTLTHDKWIYLEDRPRLETGGRQAFQVELTQGQRSAKTSVLTVSGPGGRWFLEDIDLLPLREFCR